MSGVPGPDVQPLAIPNTHGKHQIIPQLKKENRRFLRFATRTIRFLEKKA